MSKFELTVIISQARLVRTGVHISLSIRISRVLITLFPGFIRLGAGPDNTSSNNITHNKRKIV